MRRLRISEDFVPVSEFKAQAAEWLRKAAESGCYGLFIGFESLSRDTLRSHHKSTNKVERYRDLGLINLVEMYR